MNKLKFTPGPLMVCPVYADNDALSHYELRRQETGELVAEVGDPDAMINKTYKVEKANVTLYAAAPELYAQLQAMVDYFNEKFVRQHHCSEDGVLVSNLVLAEKVLKKARGE